jgi:hypothetical protein
MRRFYAVLESGKAKTQYDLKQGASEILDWSICRSKNAYSGLADTQEEATRTNLSCLNPMFVRLSDAIAYAYPKNQQPYHKYGAINMFVIAEIYLDDDLCEINLAPGDAFPIYKLTADLPSDHYIITQYIWLSYDKKPLQIPMIRLEPTYLALIAPTADGHGHFGLYSDGGLAEKYRQLQSKYEHFFIGNFLLAGLIHFLGGSRKAVSDLEKEWADTIVAALKTIGEANGEHIERSAVAGPPSRETGVEMYSISSPAMMRAASASRLPPVCAQAGSGGASASVSSTSEGGAAVPPPSVSSASEGGAAVPPPEPLAAMEGDPSLPVKTVPYYKSLFYMRKQAFPNQPFGILQSQLAFKEEKYGEWSTRVRYEDIKDTLALRLDYALFKMHNLMYPDSKP